MNNLLFISYNCPTCQNLLNLLKNEKLINAFNIFCVDGKIDKVPKYIEKVPTMIVENVNKPLVANEIFDWINKLKSAKTNTMPNTNLLGYSDIEHNNNRDNLFTSIKNDNFSTKSYFNYKDETKHAIYTAPEQKKIKESEQKSLIDKMVQKRNEQDNKFAHISEQQHKKIVQDIKRQELINSLNPEQLKLLEHQKMLQQRQQMQYMNAMNKMQQMQYIQNMNNGSFKKNK